ncbi:uncharacterized protein LOC124941828 [Impatiens glandulifera]|uniref:uncharacterized protein LOC124941828 n=1 Tax=Impatiens glandulifera TaxID=253017 RepID=UPI001FB130DB|nr:uncharacterized protein LOC124941828 [Impatiens glandulifera]
MSLLKGMGSNSWHPVMGEADTTNSSYWFNWRVFVCAIWIIVSLVFSYLLISKYEGPRRRNGENDENGKEVPGMLYEDETWMPCLKGIHPAWLLGFRLFAFFVLLILLILNVIADGTNIFYYYTQWTFALITIYFGLGSLLSIYGCNYQHHAQNVGDPECAHESIGGKFDNGRRKIAGFWAYFFQMIFQMSAGAVVLTDCVFWFIIFPFLEIKQYNINFIVINMHTMNAVFLLGDTALNCLRFQWFRISYFFLWTIFYVIFQWVVHASFTLWWPYPFLDLSSPFAPLWYLSMALMHIPCYVVFVLIMKLKYFLLSKWFPTSYQCVKY